MDQALIPENEKERIQDLIDANILNTPREERFDYITRLATLIFNAPIATIALVDKEDVWLKSVQGTNIETMSRSTSFCGHAILEKDHLIVPDATKDERFAGNEMVVNPPYVRFYAGVPLFSPKGRPLGTFCIIDSSSRELDDNQRDVLKGFARWAETEINAYNISKKLNYVAQIEEEEKFNINLQKIIIDASSRLLLNVKEEEQDEIFHKILSSLGVFFEADRSYIFLFNEDLSLMSNTHEWCSEGVESQKDTIKDFPAFSMSWFKEQIIKKEPLIVEDVDALGEEAKGDREEFLRQQIKSLVCFPMRSGKDDLIGFLGFDFIKEKNKIKQSQISIIQVISNDIAEAIERSRTVKALEDSEEKFRQIMENIDDVVWLRSADNNEMLYINPAYEKLWGREKEYIYKNPQDFVESVAEEDKDAFYNEFNHYIERGFFNLEYRINLPDGLQKWVYARGYPIYSKEGEIVKHVGVATDITARKEALLQIKKSEEKYKNLVERVRQEYFFYSYSKDGNITYLSPSVKDVTGYKTDELNNIYELPFTDNPINEKLDSYVEKALKGEGTVSYEAEVFNNNGRKMVLRLLDNSTFDIFGNITGVEGLAKDVTKEKQIEKTRTEFISLVSHQLKTPLGSMSWDMEMLLSGDYGDLNKEQRKVIDGAHNMNRRMIELVNGLLNVSRMEMGKVVIDLEEISVIEACEESIKEVKIKIIANKQEIIRNYDVNTPNIFADKKLTKIIWENIISNASKYGYKGSKIEVGTSVKEGRVVCFIKNSGRGIPKNEHGSVFKRMFRASNIEDLDEVGSGLGLYLVKSIIDATGGDIWFESLENEETLFSFSLPIDGMKKNGSDLLQN